LKPTRIYPGIYTVLKRQAVIPRGSRSDSFSREKV
jgi:hypothetical protein